jgi:hypothetical protein
MKRALVFMAMALGAPLASHAQEQLPLQPRADTAQFREFRQESEAFNRLDPFAHAFRAGRYNGYWIGVLDTLQGKTVCLRECPCEVEKRIGRYLADHPEAQEQPVVTWLVPLLETAYPCR